MVLLVEAVAEVTLRVKGLLMLLAEGHLEAEVVE